SGLDRSPLYTGIIKATGVRYCPSIEDKVVRFADRERHQIFLEPEGRSTFEYYPNGLSTSLPIDIQKRMLRSIKGLEDVQITRPGYGIEHDVADATQIYPTLETKLVKGLYLAGQVNGTTGYEEAAAQGLIAGINAALSIKDKKPLILDRTQGYIGVLIDDLTSKGTNEPYRMFTSRVEYRLLLREDNADLRLNRIGYEIGLLPKKVYLKTARKEKLINRELKNLREFRIGPSLAINRSLKRLDSSPIKRVISLEDILRRPEINYTSLKVLNHFKLTDDEQIIRQVEFNVKYAGFIQRQISEIERLKKIENIKIPAQMDFKKISGLSREIVEKLNKFAPLTLGQANRISGVTPVAISILMVHLRKLAEERKEGRG
ncbi:MAG: FAD-dependent oxidoreductase, partial [Candidatus Omnitrophota bacterium]|nr:FAD-dependent oxidoreductase [Candidatus Omnitrophota bacterium]